jgi:hypothetical protein
LRAGESTKRPQAERDIIEQEELDLTPRPGKGSNSNEQTVPAIYGPSGDDQEFAQQPVMEVQHRSALRQAQGVPSLSKDEPGGAPRWKALRSCCPVSVSAPDVVVSRRRRQPSQSQAATDSRVPE